jgi:hypothetical protein
MNEQNDKEIHELLKRSIAVADTELRRDLWPQMLQTGRQSAPDRVCAWFDWASPPFAPFFFSFRERFIVYPCDRRLL